MIGAEALAREPREADTALTAWRSSQFRFLFGGGVFAQMSLFTQQFAIGWFVVQLAAVGGNAQLGAFYLGLVGVSRAVPSLAFGLLAGVLADRADRRRLLMLSTTGQTIVAGTFALLLLKDLLSFPALIALSAIAAGLSTIDNPARIAALPNTVGTRGVLGGLALIRSASHGSTLLGPLVGGLLIDRFGNAAVMGATAGMSLLAVIALLPLRPQPPERLAHTGTLHLLRQGLSFTAREPLLGPLSVFLFLFGTLGYSYASLLPAVATTTLHVDAVGLSWLSGAAGAGALLGVAGITASTGIRQQGRLLLASVTAAALLLILLGLQHGLAPSIALTFGLGSLMVFAGGTITNLFQIRAPDELRGRIASTSSLLWQVSVPTGTLILGSLGSVIGVSVALVVGGLSVLVVCAATLARVASIRDASGWKDPIRSALAPGAIPMDA